MGIFHDVMEGATAMLRGHRGTRSMQVQSVLFDRDLWTEARAKQWLKRHSLLHGKVDVTERHLRYRQKDPGQYKVLRTIQFGDGEGIKAIVGR